MFDKKDIVAVDGILGLVAGENLRAKEAWACIKTDIAEALKPSHNNDYASALRDIIRTYFGNVPETTIGAIIEDVQRLNTDCQYRE